MSDKDKLLAGTIEHLAALAVELMRGQEQAPKVKVGIRDMKAELSAEPVSYADEFDATEDLAKLRRERDEARADQAKITEYAATQEKEAGKLASTIDAVWNAMGDNPPPGPTHEAVKGLRQQRDEAIEKLEDSRATVHDFNTLIGRVWRALGVSAGGSLDDVVAAQRRELLDLRSRVELGGAENRRLVEAAESQGRTIAKIQIERNEARAALEKQRQAFPGEQFENLRSQVLDYRQRLGAVESALDAEAVIQDYTERVKDEAAAAAQEELTHLKTERATLVKELGKAQDRVKFAESEWAKAASQRDVLRQQIEGNEAPTQGEES